MKFKVGDRISVYGHDGNGNAIRKTTAVTGFNGTGLLYVEEKDCFKPGSNGFDLTMPHPKACRKLKRQKCSKCGRS